MKTLSLWQPWASLVAIGAKRIETRSWSTSYRGLLAIHAAKRFPSEARRLVFEEPFFSVLHGAGYADIPVPGLLGVERLPQGAIVAVAELEAIKRVLYTPPTEPVDLWISADMLRDQERAFGDYTPGRYAWFLRSIKRLNEPVPCSGARGLYELDYLVEKRVREALAA